MEEMLLHLFKVAIDVPKERQLTIGATATSHKKRNIYQLLQEPYVNDSTLV